MAENWFAMSSPRDMLGKAKREYDRMQNSISMDNIFNFFVTACHVMDYVKALKTVPASAVQAMQDDSDFDMCRFICNKGKHLELTRNNYDGDYKAEMSRGAELGRMMLADPECVLGTGPVLKFTCDGKEVDVRGIATRILAKWEQFFADNGIS